MVVALRLEERTGGIRARTAMRIERLGMSGDRR
jgi:hypothetical protein